MSGNDRFVAMGFVVAWLVLSVATYGVVIGVYRVAAWRRRRLDALAARYPRRHRT